MQVDHVRHHGRAENADREQHGLVSGELGDDGVLRDRPERRMSEPELTEVADPDHDHERGDHRLERPESIPLKSEDQERDHAGDDGGGEERDAEQQLDPERGAEKLGEVRRHRDQLGLDPEAERGAAREAVAADLGQVAPRGDPELGRQRLDQHRHQVRDEDHPAERVAELRAARDVGGEVSRVDVGDAGDECGAEERQDPPAAAGTAP